ncbi:MAG: hypothetical protein Q7U74_10575 [Saprospiraceae bacterium]|nr:hypothetical protein [Saprospiraceae bacterium]
MLFKKKTLFILLFIWTAVYASAQVTTVRRYNPSGNTQAQAPQTYSTPTPEAVSDAASRRKAALSKVQGTAPTKSFTAKGGVAPAQYSTDGPIPVEYVAAPMPATTFTVNGANVERKVRKGQGQVGDLLFTPISELHYVQFAVYCKNTPVDKAPQIEGLMLLWHEGSKCPGGETGACYIVKGYNTADEAKAAVLQFKANRFDCWYNPALTGAAVEVIGVRS